MRENVDREQLVGELVTLRQRIARLEPLEAQHVQMARALHESDSRFRQLVEHIDEVFWLRTEERYLYISPVYERVWGRPCASLYADPNANFEYMYPEDRERLLTDYDIDRFRRDEVFTEEFRIVRPDGTLRWIEIKSFPITDERGQIHQRAGVCRDITDRKLTEKEVRRQYRELAMLNRATRLFNSTLDLAQVLSTVLEEVCRLLDVVAASVWLIEPGTHELVCWQASGTGSETVRGWRLQPGQGILGWVAQTGQDLIVTDAQADERHFKDIDERTGVLTRAALTVPLQVQRTTIGVIQVLDSEPSRFVPADLRLLGLLASSAAIAIDNALLHQQARKEIAERERVTDALRESEQTLRGIIEQSQDGIVLADERGAIIEWNKGQEQIAGLGRAEVLGRLLWDVQMQVTPKASRSPEAHTRLQRTMVEFLETGQAPWLNTLQEHEICRPDGTQRTVQILAFPIHTNRGFMAGSIVRDVTERKHLEEQLQQTQKIEAIGRLAGGVAHDFNNLLTAIQGYVVLLQQDLASDSPQDWPPSAKVRSDLREVERAADRAAALTRQLLAFGRKQMLQPRVLNLNEVVQNIEKMLRRLISEDIELHTVLDPTLGHVTADPGQIDQVIMNLAVNARDAMPDGGRLSIETDNVCLDQDDVRQYLDVVPGPYVRLRIGDTGIGMTEEVKSHLFEPFFTTKEVGKGTGLGLATVYGIVKQSGGHITCDSAPGVGTTFSVYLPSLERQAEGVERTATAEALPRGTETVLVVEDEALVRELVCRALTVYGYTVLEASHPDEALHLARQHPGQIELLVADVVLPGMSGQDLAKRILGERPETKVLYVSGYADSAIVRRGIVELGAAFLQKPFRLGVLMRRVRELLDAPLSGSTSG